VDGLVDQVRIMITDNSVAQNVLYTQFYPVAYTFKNTSGITDESIAKNLSLYPVPCTDRFTLVYPTNEAFEYRVYNLQGSLMLVKVLTSGKVISKMMVKQ
jgi:hypothetical protein